MSSEHATASFALEYMLLQAMIEVMGLLDYLEEKHGEEIEGNPRFHRANTLISLHILWQRRDPNFMRLLRQNGGELCSHRQGDQALENAPKKTEGARARSSGARD